MISRNVFLLLLPLLVGCGGSSPPAALPSPSPAASPATSITNPPSSGAPSAASVVRFDDLGVSFTVPPGMRVIGDDELASRIRTSANAHLTEELKARAQQKKGLPLLTLVKDGATTANDALGLVLTVAAIPADSTATEVMGQQTAVMKDNLLEFSIDRGPTALTLDGVQGSDLEDAYVLHGDNGPQKMRSHVRLFVRKDRAFTITVVWRASAPPERELEAKALIDGLHFYDPTP